jgi:hypothetical protein
MVDTPNTMKSGIDSACSFEHGGGIHNPAVTAG